MKAFCRGQEMSARMTLRIAIRGALVGMAMMTLALLVSGCSKSDGGDDLAAQGEPLYAQNCQSCHGDATTGAGRLTALIPSHGQDGHTWHHADGQLADIILGRFTYPGREMPSFEDTLTEDQVEAILAYLKLGWNEEMLEFQAEVSRNWEEL